VENKTQKVKGPKESENSTNFSAYETSDTLTRQSGGDTADSNPPKQRKISPKRVFILIGASLTVVLIVVGILAALAFLTPDKKIKNGEIIIGNITLTQEMFDANHTEMDEYLKERPDERGNYEEGDLREITKRDLIKNAALKDQAKKCNVTIGIKDLAAVFGGPAEDASDAKEFVTDNFGEEGGFRYVRLENMAYTGNEKLTDCTITTKQIFSAFLTYDSPNFVEVSKDQAQAAFDEAKTRMQNEVLPLFEQGLSSKDIEKKADIPTPGLGVTPKGERPGWYTMQSKWEDGMFNDIPDIEYDFDIGSPASVNDAVKQLKKTSDHTGLLVGQNGDLIIVRLEAEPSSGVYDSWDAFFEEIFNQYAYTKASIITSSVKRFAISTLNGMMNLVFGIQDAFAACDPGVSHRITINVTINGSGTVKIIQPFNGNACNDSRSSSGPLYATCWKYGPRFVFTAAKGYKFSSRSFKTNSYVSCSDREYSPTKEKWYNDVCLFESSANGSGVINVTVTFIEAIEWSLEPQKPTVSKSTKVDYKVDTVTYAHQVKNTGPKEVPANKMTIMGGTGTVDDMTESYNSGKISGALNSGNTTGDSRKTTLYPASATLPASNSTHPNPQKMSSAGVGKGKYCKRTYAKPKSNLSKSTSTVRSDNTCIDVISPWTIAVSSSSPTTDRGEECLKDSKSRPNCDLTFKHTVQESNGRVVKDDDGNNVKVTATVYQYVNDGNSEAKPSSSYWTAVNSAGGSVATIGENGYIIGSASGGKANVLSVTENHVGKTVCQFVRSDWSGRGSHSNQDSTPACIYIPYNYTTQPDVIGLGDGTAEAGSIVNVKKTLLVDNVQGTNPEAIYKTKTMSITERVVCYVNGVAGCPGWNEEASVTTQAFASSQSGNVGASVQFTVPAGASVGTEYCFYAVVDGSNGTVISGSASGSTTSPERCIRVVKGPTMQIQGGESWAGSACVGEPSTFGGFRSKTPVDQVNVVSATWSQYGLFALGDIEEGFGSGGWIRPLSTANAERSHLMKFAQPKNELTDGTGGGYVGTPPAHCVTDMYSYYTSMFGGVPENLAAPYDLRERFNDGEVDEGSEGPIIPLAGSPAESKMTIGNKQVWFGDATQLDEADLGLRIMSEHYLTDLLHFSGKDQVLVIKGNLTIEADIVIYDECVRYNGAADGNCMWDYNHQKEKSELVTTGKLGMKKLSDIPSLTVVVSGDIILGPGVNRLDGVYYAGGSLHTCDKRADREKYMSDDDAINFSVPEPNDYTYCSEPLVVNGAIIVKGQSRFNRTVGADNVYEPTPAEVLKYSSNVWLQEYGFRKSIDSNIQTVLYREGAPRV